MALYDTYQGRVGRAQGSSRLFVAADGYFNVGDTAGGIDGLDILGSQLRYQLLSPVTRTSFTMASAIQTVSVIPNSCGLVMIIYPSATTSVKMPAANVGATLILQFGIGVASQVSILAATSASLIIGHSDLSMVLASVNGVSGAWIEFQCFTANEWAVAECSSWGGIFAGQRSS